VSVAFPLRRLIYGVVSLLILTLIIFVCTHLLPGDAATAMLGENATPEALAALRSPLAAGEERPVSPDAIALVGEIASVLDKGYGFLFDYGFVSGEAPPKVRSYRAHRILFDVLEDPGERDVTAGADFGAIAEEARRAGLLAFGPVRQAEALHALGLGEWKNAVKTRWADAERTGDARAGLRLRTELTRADLLADPEHLGSLRLLVLATQGLSRPRAIP
jgi:SAM-dependent MidA family methyltransferase